MIDVEFEIMVSYVVEIMKCEIEILNEVEVDGYCEHCMTLFYLCTIAR